VSLRPIPADWPAATENRFEVEIQRKPHPNAIRLDLIA
jgi:hypothetical protein